jgi:hypothetical protein
MTQQYWWKPGVVSLPSMSVGSGVKGGFVRVAWGSISFAPDSYASEPPAKATVDLEWGLDSSDTIHIFDGEIYRRSYTNKSINYDIFEPEYDTKALTEGVAVKNEIGDPDVTAFEPLLIGTVNYVAPQRTGLNTEEKYYMPDFATYDFFDDGVLINDNWTIGATYAERTVAIVGTLTISGTGNMVTLNDVFTWAATEMGLSYENIHGGDVALNCVVTSQMLMVDLLDTLAYYCSYQFYIKNDTIYLVDMNQDNGEQEIEEFDFVEIQYTWPMTIKKYSSAWTLKEFDATTTTLIDDPQEVEYFTDNPVGDKVTITAYDQTVDDVTTKIEAIAAQDAKVVIALSLPLDRLPAIGEKITFIDRKQSHNITGYLRVRSYSLNYSSKTLDLSGNGEITFA